MDTRHDIGPIGIVPYSLPLLRIMERTRLYVAPQTRHYIKWQENGLYGPSTHRTKVVCRLLPVMHTRDTLAESCQKSCLPAHENGHPHGSQGQDCPQAQGEGYCFSSITNNARPPKSESLHTHKIEPEIDIKVTMSFLQDWMPLAPFTDEEIHGAEVRIKEEATEDVTDETREDVTDETCLEIKEESLDYADEATDEASEAKLQEGCPFYNDVNDIKQEESEKDSDNALKYCNDALLIAPSVAECFTNKGSSNWDQATYMGNREEGAHGNWDRKRVHTKEKPNSSELCENAFSHKQALIEHMGVPTKGKSHSCQVCERAFTRKGHLVIHMRVHTKEKPYSCELCKKAFTRKGHLEGHMRIHTKEKPYSCQVCEKAFSHKKSVVDHMRVHTKEKPFSCQHCEKVFTRKYSLVCHMRVHTNEKPYGCETCKKAFSERATETGTKSVAHVNPTILQVVEGEFKSFTWGSSIG
ncbi:zinc finger and SCAN domain-containing protein 2-like [Penaeus japonicus]|uniref:zinc finger and SCAN domain-containing protein 2-like n=1 Tax=Penaeus japonicus TaxID=27405 RepID=UPI001C711E32|nr:zinc finger and SCAN domain-containing protein 2-like [Penaeus japonicus]